MSDEQEFIGYEAAAGHLKMSAASLKYNVVRHRGPAVARRAVDRQYVRPVFTASELERWYATRPGRGRRTDLGSKTNEQ